MQKLAKEKSVWEMKLAQANSDLEKTKDKVYVQKCRHHLLVQQHLNDEQENKDILKNYNKSLQIDNKELWQMLKRAVSNKNSANRSAKKAKCSLTIDCSDFSRNEFVGRGLKKKQSN